MKKSRFTDEQIIGFLKQVEAECRLRTSAASTVSVTRRSTSGAAGWAFLVDVSEARRMREFESENTKLKKMLAEAMLDIESLRVVARGRR